MCSPQIPLDRRMSTNKMLRLLLACGVVFTTVRMYTMRKATAVQQNGQHCLDTGAARVTGRLVTCTRIHRKKAGNTHGEDVQALKQLIVQAVAYSDHIAIAVDQADGELMQQVSDMVEDCKQIIKKEVPIDVLPVSIWGNFVPALNALLMHAVKINAAVILYTSVELQMSSSQVDSLRDQLTDSTLVVGAQVPGHDFDVGRHVLTGRNSPWNTFALWSVAKLAQVGFMPISEGIFGIPGGVEEGPVIALLQRLQPSSMCCKLVQLDPAPKWHRDWSDPQRLQWHQEKMQSKVTRTTSQLEYMHLPEAFVDHIQVTVPSHESGVP